MVAIYNHLGYINNETKIIGGRMKKNILIAIAFTFLVGSLSFLSADTPDKGNQTLCPVMGNAVNNEIYSDYDGQRVFFCCEGCRAPFEKEPEKYLKKMKEMGIEPMKLKKQATCPVSGKDINTDSYIDVNGKRVFVCCDGCKAKVKSEPVKYFKKVAEMGEYLEDLKEE